MIIHIDGLSGTGKTTLGKNISSQLKISVIELDDISDHNIHKIISKYNYDINQITFDKNQRYSEFTSKLFENFTDELLKLNQIDFDKKLENYKDKNLLITGCIHNMVINIDKGYFIKLDNEIHYKQQNSRHLDRIYENSEEIKEILNSNISLYYKQKYIARKCLVVQGFLPDYNHFVKQTEKQRNNANIFKYKYATQDEIFNDIEQLLKK